MRCHVKMDTSGLSHCTHKQSRNIHPSIHPSFGRRSMPNPRLPGELEGCSRAGSGSHGGEVIARLRVQLLSRHIEPKAKFSCQGRAEASCARVFVHDGLTGQARVQEIHARLARLDTLQGSTSAPQHFNLAEDQPEAKLPLGCSGAGGLRTCRVPEVQEKEGLSQR